MGDWKMIFASEHVILVSWGLCSHMTSLFSKGGCGLQRFVGNVTSGSIHAMAKKLDYLPILGGRHFARLP